jgi:hypothetical protein
LDQSTSLRWLAFGNGTPRNTKMKVILGVAVRLPGSANPPSTG